MRSFLCKSLFTLGLIPAVCFVFAHVEEGSSSFFTFQNGSDIETINKNLQCGLYLADSTIPNAGLGIFTAETIEKGDRLVAGDVCLPLLDLKFHNGGRRKFFYPLEDYVWNGLVMGMDQEVDGVGIDAFWPGIDSCVNCNLALVNVDKATPIYDEGGLHRAVHPGAGAITPYHNGTSKVLRQIPAGGELFKNYGDDWFLTRPKHFNRSLPLLNDYQEAKDLLHQFDQLFSDSGRDEKGHVDALRIRSMLYGVLTFIRDVWDTRMLRVLPTSYKDAQRIIEADDAGVIHQPKATRSVEWLRAHGTCIDNIEAGQSTIPGAGHGAFAKRSLPGGTTITSSPLHHVPAKTMHIFESMTNTKTGKEKRSKQIIGKQLLLNYCFGHPESTLLLCPYGAGVNYINHNKTLANVKIRWSKNGHLRQNDTWLVSMTPDDMMGIYQQHLAFDYVATKDIKQGDELFINYGDLWEQAWGAHSTSWNPPNHWKYYMSASQFNKQYTTARLRTEKEQEDDPYPENLLIRCHEKMLKKTWNREKKVKWRPHKKGYPCVIRSRNDGVTPNTYDVEVFDYQRGIEYDDEFVDLVERTGVRRDAISFVDAPYSTDMHLLHAFRHAIQIPEELMPQMWKDHCDRPDGFSPESK